MRRMSLQCLWRKTTSHSVRAIDFLKIVSDMSPSNTLAKKKGAGQTKTTQIIKCKGNQSSVWKKSNEHSVCLRR